MREKRRADRQARSGVILAAVLISLLAVMLVAAALTKAALLHHRQSQMAELRQQAFWLAESAVQRAMHALDTSPDYTGETWRLPASVLGAGRSGAVTIRVEKTAASRHPRRVRVEARYPEGGAQRIVVERDVWIESDVPASFPNAGAAGTPRIPGTRVRPKGGGLGTPPCDM